MIRSVYQTSMGMLALQKKQEAISNNIANSETIGYKGKTLLTEASFSEMLVNYAGKNRQNPVVLGRMSLGTRVSGLETDLLQGGLIETGKPFDVALEGSGYLQLATSGGRVLSRNGELHLNSADLLVDRLGNPVLGENAGGQVGAIRLNGIENVVIRFNGDLIQNGIFVARIMIVETEAEIKPEISKDGAYFLQPAALKPQTTTRLRQGFLETSNVDTTNALIDMMSTGRLLQGQQKILSTLDETLNRAANEIGKL